MRSVSFLALAAGVSAEVFFKETFDASYGDRWTVSGKDGLGEFKHTAGEFFGDEEANKGLQTSQDAKFYAISAPIPTPVDNKDKPMIVSFQLKDAQGIDCGGGYLKVLREPYSGKEFNGESPYWMMFGPDICGSTKKIHLILNYKGENLLWKKESRPVDDRLTHVYTAIINTDGTYELQVDGEKKESGKLEEDWAFLKPKEIDDPEDKKPGDWVDDAQMDDPEDSKPADWGNEPETIPDPEAEQPEDWDEEDDGAWEAPQIPNPKFQGEWKAKRISNPAYKGVWSPKRIPNPDYVEDKNMHVSADKIAGVGIDLWQVKSGTVFDNIIISDSIEEVNAFVADTWGKTKDGEKAAFDKAEAAKKAAAEAESKKEEEEKEDEE
jgi:calreticulin